MRLAGATTAQQANNILWRLLPDFNRRFGVCAAQQGSAYRQLSADLSLDSVLCFKYLRTVANDNTVRFNSTTPTPTRHIQWRSKRLGQPGRCTRKTIGVSQLPPRHLLQRPRRAMRGNVHASGPQAGVDFRETQERVFLTEACYLASVVHAGKTIGMSARAPSSVTLRARNGRRATGTINTEGPIDAALDPVGRPNRVKKTGFGAASNPEDQTVQQTWPRPPVAEKATDIIIEQLD